MTNNKEHWIKSAWSISIGTAIFSLFLTMGYDYFKDKPVLTTISIFLKWIGNLAWAVLNFDIKVWWIIVTIALLIIILLTFAFLEKKEPILPDFYDYKEDRFNKWKWTWNWSWSSSENAWLINNPKAHCPKCDTPLIDNSNRYGLRFDCPRCEYRAGDYECDDPFKVERIIIDNIERRRTQKKKSL